MCQVSNAVYISTSLAANVDMPFRFLDLPAELRTYVYEFATSSLEANVKLSHRPDRKNSTQPQGLSTLTQVCKEIRGEFLPLYMKIVPIEINLRALQTFMSTFAPAPVPGVLTCPPMKVGICIHGSNTSSSRSWRIDMRPFFLAVARTPKPWWHFH
jgi:hypothetical protein